MREVVSAGWWQCRSASTASTMQMIACRSVLRPDIVASLTTTNIIFLSWPEYHGCTRLEISFPRCQLCACAVRPLYREEEVSGKVRDNLTSTLCLSTNIWCFFTRPCRPCRPCTTCGRMCMTSHGRFQGLWCRLFLEN